MTDGRSRYPLIWLALSVGVAVPAHATLTWSSMAMLMGTFNKQIYVVGDPLIIVMICGLSVLIAYGLGRFLRWANPGRVRQAAIATGCLLPIAHAILVGFIFYFSTVDDDLSGLSEETPISWIPYIPYIVGYFTAAMIGLLLATRPSPPHVTPSADVPK